MSSPVKLLMTWDIAPGQEKACFTFINEDLLSSMKQGGLERTDAWFTAYGDWPQIRIGFVSSDMQAFEAYISSDDWRELKRRLLTYTRNYKQKVVLARGGFQL